MTHGELVERAEKWLRNTFHCRVVMSEHVAYTRYGEIPDVIGWVNGKSILVECKTSRADFLRDKAKPFRDENALALGAWRFYLTPPGIITASEVPEGWGLYEVHGRIIRHVAGNKYRNAATRPFAGDLKSEIAMLLSYIAKCNKS